MKGRPLLVVMVALWSFASCITDHDQLAKQGEDGATTATVSSGGMGGTAPLIDSATSSGGTFGGTMSLGPRFEYGEDGPDELTLIHGQVDSRRIAFCFAPVEDGAPGDPDGDPLPEGGLKFGEHVTTRSPGGLSFEDDAILPIVLAGDLASIEGADCKEALDQVSWVSNALGAAGAAGAAAIGDGVHAMALAQLPAGSLTLGRRYLLAVVGCMTAPANADSGYADRCGAPRASNAPTLAPLLVTASRETRSDRMGLQILHASAGSEPITFEVFPSQVGNARGVTVASNLVFGQLSPPTPNLNLTASEFGVDTGGDVHVFQRSTRELQVPWSELAEASGIEELVDGETYALVLLGPRAGTERGGGYQGSQLTLIHSSSETSDD